MQTKTLPGCLVHRKIMPLRKELNRPNITVSMESLLLGQQPFIFSWQSLSLGYWPPLYQLFEMVYLLNGFATRVTDFSECA